MAQYDLKRVIAFSTCSQMGYLFMSVGIAQYSYSLFHLANHAFTLEAQCLTYLYADTGLLDQQVLVTSMTEGYTGADS